MLGKEKEIEEFGGDEDKLERDKFRDISLE